MKILVPVDFFETSFAAFKYAASLANVVGGEIILLHIINGMMNIDETFAHDPSGKIEQISNERLKSFVQNFPKIKGVKIEDVKITKIAIFGIPGIAVSDYAEENDIDLIVMGTRDKHGVFDRLLGSVSITTIKEAKCPVILIHESTKWRKPNKILFTLDKDSDLEAPLEQFVKFNKKLHAHTDFLHIDIKSKDDIQEQKEKIISRLFKDEKVNFSFEVKRLTGNSLKSSLSNYCMFESIDLITMVHRKKGVLEQIFSKSKSVEIGTSLFLPVLIFKEKKTND
ncbi:MAG: nucleotide-binding universal stress UspA family protein [Saprospiraceae bacterium]|jgi:nucleotide-binding universal stress UspA family protein|tara:strand:- start:247 stop:1092 length:846 start_codon:yes stop_codon:yes gene_type:complete